MTETKQVVMKRAEISSIVRVDHRGEAIIAAESIEAIANRVVEKLTQLDAAHIREAMKRKP